MSFFRIIFFLLFSLTSFAQTSDFIEGKANFYAHSDDSLAFVKKHLIYRATEKIVTKAMDDLGLDSDKFWKNYNQRFDEHFGTIEEGLRKKFKVDEEDVPAKRMKTFKDRLRVRKLEERSKFSKLSKTLTSYAIKKMSRSFEDPASRYIHLEAKVNLKALNQIYFSTIQALSGEKIERLFISTNYNFSEINWPALELSNSNELSDVIDQHWKTYLNDRLGKHFKEVTVIFGDSKEKLQSYLSLSDEARSNMMSDTDSSYKQFQNSLWLHINVDLKKLTQDVDLKLHEFDLNLNFLLYDLRAGQPIFGKEFDQKKISFRSVNPSQLGSSMATSIYRIPIAEFSKLKKRVMNLPSILSKVNIELVNASSVDDASQVKNLIQKLGFRLRAKAELDSYTYQKLVMKVFFSGEEGTFRKILKKLDRRSLKSGKRITFPSIENPYKIVLEDLPSVIEDNFDESSKAL